MFDYRIYPSYKCTKFQTNLTIYAFPRAPQRFTVHLASRTESPGPKNQNFQKMKKHHQGFTQAISVPNFRQIWPFMPSLGRPKACRTHTRTNTLTHTLSGSSSTEVENTWFNLQHTQNKKLTNCKLLFH